MQKAKKKRRLKKFNVFYDPFAKSLLRSEEMRPLLANVLSTITGFSEQDILNATFIGGELPKDNLKQKGQIADIIIHLDERRSIVLEINQGYYPEIVSKNGYYAMQVALTKRNSDISEPEVWLVNIDKHSFNKLGNVPQYFKVLDEEFGKVTEFSGYKSVHLPIDYIIANRYNRNKKLYQFAQIFNAKSLKEVKAICEGDEILMPIAEKIEKLTGDPNFLLYYDYEEAKELAAQGREKYAKELGHASGLAEGHASGLAEGLASGKAEGLVEGRLELISNMLSSGMSKEEISKCTKVSLDEIDVISNKTKIYAKTH